VKIGLGRRLKTGSWIGFLMESLSLSKLRSVRRSGGDIGELSAEEWKWVSHFGGKENAVLDAMFQNGIVHLPIAEI
jgi:hypothetical protein